MTLTELAEGLERLAEAIPHDKHSATEYWFQMEVDWKGVHSVRPVLVRFREHDSMVMVLAPLCDFDPESSQAIEMLEANHLLLNARIALFDDGLVLVYTRLLGHLALNELGEAVSEVAMVSAVYEETGSFALFSSEGEEESGAKENKSAN